MIKDALQYIVGLGKPTIQEICNETYSDRSLHLVKKRFDVQETIQLSTLSSLVDYVNGSVDIHRINMSEKMLIQVVNPTKVRLLSEIDEYGHRDCLIEVNASIPNFPFGQYVDSEEFLIRVRSNMQPNEDSELLIKFSGSTEEKSVQAYTDDGISQKVTLHSGIGSKSEAKVPNPVLLRPFRTFTEIEQPESEFVFRMKNDRGVQCAIFEADGGAWKHYAMESIAEYLSDQLVDKTIDNKFIIIS